jgi:hypothetical protein
MSNPPTGTTHQASHLDSSVTVAHGKVGHLPSVTASVLEARTGRVAIAHMTPDEARAVASTLHEMADYVDSLTGTVKKAEPKSEEKDEDPAWDSDKKHSEVDETVQRTG